MVQCCKCGREEMKGKNWLLGRIRKNVAARYEVGVEEAARRNCLQEKVDRKEKMNETGMQWSRKKQKPQGTPRFAISIFPIDEIGMIMIPT